MIGYEVTIKGLEEAVKTFQNADKIIQQEFKTAMSKSTIKVASAAKKGAPVGVSGELRASITSKVTPIGARDVEGRVGSPLPYAVYVEMGTRPHYPPLEPLVLWVQRKLSPSNDWQAVMIARAIQLKIGRVGTKGVKFLEAAINDTEDDVNGYFDAALDHITERLAKE